MELVNRGCPHGGVLSSLLWNMMLDGLLRRLYNAHYQAQNYADDVVLLQKGKFVSTLCDRMQGLLNCVENWCREIGLFDRDERVNISQWTINRGF
jgi:hypothetical protein